MPRGRDINFSYTLEQKSSKHFPPRAAAPTRGRNLAPSPASAHMASEDEAVYVGLSRDRISRAEQILCCTTSEATTASTRRAVNLNLGFVLVDAVTLAYMLVTEDHLRTSDGWELLNVLVAAPILTALHCKLRPGVIEARQDGSRYAGVLVCCRLAAIGYGIGLLCDVGDLLDAQLHKTLARLLSVIADLSTLYTWLNVIYMLEMLRAPKRQDWFKLWNQRGQSVGV